MIASVVHVVAGLGKSQGGPSYSVPRLCAAEREAGAAVKLCAVESVGDEPLPGVVAEFYRHDFTNFPLVANLRISGGLRSRLDAIVPEASVVHVHGIWLMPNVDAGGAAHRNHKPLVVSPRGMVAPEALRISRGRKWAIWKLMQERAYSGAALWHATCEAEADEIRNFGVRAPIAVIPNGVDIVSSARTGPGAASPDPRPNTMLYLGRLHPKKGLPALIRAWSEASRDFPNWRLRIVGPDENGHAGDLRLLASQLGAERISIDPPVFGADKTKALLDASVFILPTLNENFGIAVAEALGAGAPAIVTKGAPWGGLVKEACGWWVDQGVRPLCEAMQAAMRTPSQELCRMGERGRAWVSREFAWDRIAADMLAVYHWLSHGGAAPSAVRMNQ